jgi:hypothetical protein
VQGSKKVFKKGLKILQRLKSLLTLPPRWFASHAGVQERVHIAEDKYTCRALDRAAFFCGKKFIENIEKVER